MLSLVTIVPASPIPLLSTLQLVASVIPDSAVTKIIWAAPDGISVKNEATPSTGVLAKVPRVQKKDSGAYTCMVLPGGNSRNNLFPFNVDVAVDGEQSGEECTCTSGLETSAAALFIQASCSHNSSKYLLQESIFKSLR